MDDIKQMVGGSSESLPFLDIQNDLNYLIEKYDDNQTIVYKFVSSL